MKSTPALSYAPHAALLVPLLAALLAALLAGCGQTGPLTMPKPPAAKPANAANATKPAADIGKPGVAPASAPVPSTPPASQQ